MIYHCKDKNLQFGKTSACIWDGTVNQKTVPNGNYHVTIRYKIKENGLVLTEKGVVNVVE
jgi:flagellar hook assembly protein FlgD